MMTFEEMGMLYLSYKPWKRISFLCFLAMAPSVFDFQSRWDGIQNDKKNAESHKIDADKKLKDALDKHNKILELEAKLNEYEDKIKVARKKLPEVIYIDQVLEKAELISKDLGIDLQLFEPGTEVPSETVYKYLKLPIHLQTVGTFGQITTFFDRIVHLEILTHIENIKLDAEYGTDDINIKDMNQSSKEYRKLEEMKRSKVRIRASFDIVVFRSYTDAELQAVQSVYEKKKGDAKVPGQVGTTATAPGAPAGTEPAQKPSPGKGE